MGTNRNIDSASVTKTEFVRCVWALTRPEDLTKAKAKPAKAGEPVAEPTKPAKAGETEPSTEQSKEGYVHAPAGSLLTCTGMVFGRRVFGPVAKWEFEPSGWNFRGISCAPLHPSSESIVLGNTMGAWLRLLAGLGRGQASSISDGRSATDPIAFIDSLGGGNSGRSKYCLGVIDPATGACGNAGRPTNIPLWVWEGEILGERVTLSCASETSESARATLLVRVATEARKKESQIAEAGAVLSLSEEVLKPSLDSVREKEKLSVKILALQPKSSAGFDLASILSPYEKTREGGLGYRELSDLVWGLYTSSDPYKKSTKGN